MIKHFIGEKFKKLGYDIPRRNNFALERNGEFLEFFKKINQYSTHSIQRLYGLYKAVLYVVQNDIPGDFVECGVLKGGSSMLCALTLLSLGETKRQLFLYDTYEGMAEPTEKDVTFFNLKAKDLWKKMIGKKTRWNYCPLYTVKENMYSIGYPKENIIFVKGEVEKTLPANKPVKIALLHLDTDWFGSTFHELMHLYPLLSNLGVLIIDDYGTWLGQREAVNRYIAENKLKILLNRIDSYAYVGVKTSKC